MHRESFSRKRDNQRLGCGLWQPGRMASCFTQRGWGEGCRAEIRFLCTHSPSSPALLPPGEGRIRMSPFSSIFVANYGKLNKTVVEPRRARRTRRKTIHCTEYGHHHAGELPISRNPMKNLRDLRVLRGELSFSGSCRRVVDDHMCRDTSLLKRLSVCAGAA